MMLLYFEITRLYLSPATVPCEIMCGTLCVYFGLIYLCVNKTIKGDIVCVSLSHGGTPQSRVWSTFCLIWLDLCVCIINDKGR